MIQWLQLPPCRPATVGARHAAPVPRVVEQQTVARLSIGHQPRDALPGARGPRGKRGKRGREAGFEMLMKWWNKMKQVQLFRFYIPDICNGEDRVDIEPASPIVSTGWNRLIHGEYNWIQLNTSISLRILRILQLIRIMRITLVLYMWE